MRSQAEMDERNLAREKLHAEIKAKNKQFKLQANNEFQQQKQDAEMKVQLAQMELMERRELEFQQEKMREKKYNGERNGGVFVVGEAVGRRKT